MKKPDKPVLVIIVPCFNEEEALPETAKVLTRKIEQFISASAVSPQSTLLFVDDGSQDATWNLIEIYHSENPAVFCGIKLPVNTGHQNALLCGLLYIKEYADITVTIDADLQDDVEAIDRMLDGYFSGSEIVLGVRSDRKDDGFFKRTSAVFFYGLMRFLGADLVANHADFRLMGRESLNALLEQGNLFLRGIVPKLGYKTGVVYYERKKRCAGKSKYTMRKMLRLAGLAFIGITRKQHHPQYHIEKTLFITEQT